MKPRITFFRLTALVLLLIVGSGLMAAGEVLARERVAYRLKWLINASTAGDVFALSQGFFSREGLEVTVKAGGPERDAIRELELGRIQDLAGRTVGITYGGNDETIMRALLATAGMGENQVRLASVRYDYTPFFQNQVQVWPVYRNTQGIFLSDKLMAGGERVAFFDPSEYGVRFVANSVVTSQKMMRQHPQTVQQFTRALLAGWQTAMEPANETAVILAVGEHDRDTSQAVMHRQLAVTRQMIQPDPDVPVGHIDTAAWQQTEQIMIRQKLIPGPVNVIDRLKPQQTP
ncbi:MAG: ABC transporter substrate-binding protein [Desulfosarcina sp.]|nr:ABC transporter substrate-binding protein [Desulfosarcina sp.]MBC2765226.1 ABC transporter substrate-binding protein [Desulfosarcina sp.]